jgi:hypothetical protein
MVIIPSRKARAMLAEPHAHRKLNVAFQTGDQNFIRMKIRAWQRLDRARRKAS